jgi:hypothetical protein
MHYTPSEQRIIDLLADGMPHERREVLACLKDEMATLNSLSVMIHRLRPKVRELGQEIVTEYRRGGYWYRHIILLSGRVPLGAES